jgi:flagellar secretion chaperone FliS
MWSVTNGDLKQQAHSDYLQSQVLSARPAERVYLLYDVAINSVRVAIEKLKDKDVFARGKAINKAHEAVDELNFALDHSMGANFTHKLSELYLYIQRQLVVGHSQKCEQALQDALSVLTTLADTWKVVVEQTCGTVPSVLSSQRTDSSELPEEEVRSRSPEASGPLTAYSGLPQEPVNSRDWSG